MDDNITNLKNWAILPTEYYDMAVKNTRAIKQGLEACNRASLSVTGHSLGGGLAATAGIVNNVSATTFNAAGVNLFLLNRYGGTMTQDPKNLVTNFVVPREILSTMQAAPLLWSAVGKQVNLGSGMILKMRWLNIKRSLELRSMSEVLKQKTIIRNH